MTVTVIRSGVKVQDAQITGKVAPIPADLGALRVLWGAGWFDLAADEIVHISIP